MPGSARPHGLTDEELIGRVRQGETRLFAELVVRYQDKVFGMALRAAGAPAEAEDIAQEAFLRAYRGLEGFKGDAQFSTWLYRITWNLCADWLRRNRKRGRMTVPMDKAGDLADRRVDIEEGLVTAAEGESVRRALEDLDEKYRSVVSLHYYQKMSYEQIAAVLNLPVKTVETRLYRARRTLRESLRRAGRGGTR